MARVWTYCAAMESRYEKKMTSARIVHDYEQESVKQGQKERGMRKNGCGGEGGRLDEGAP